MKLLYLYLPNYPPFPKDTEFNFDSNWRFEFDHDKGVITCDETDALPDNFYGDDTNVDCVSAIVGSNGVGKTSIAKVLTELFASGKIPCPEHILIYQIDNVEVKVCYSLKSMKVGFQKKIQPKTAGGKVFTKHEVNFHQWDSADCTGKNLWDDFRFVYLSPFFTTEGVIVPLNGNDIIDLSTTGLLAKETAETNATMNILFIHKENEIKRAVRFFRESGATCIENIHLPQGMEIYASRKLFEGYVSAIEKKVSMSSDNVKHKLQEKLGSDKFQSQNGIVNKAKLCYIAMKLDEMPLPDLVHDKFVAEDKLTDDFFQKWICEHDQAAGDFFDWLGKYYVKYLKAKELEGYGFPDHIHLKLTEKNAPMMTFTHKYFACIKNQDFLHYEFYPRLSSGEMAYITMFARLFDKLKQDSHENYLVFLDEVEICLHPEWQRCLVKNFLTFFQQYFPRKRFHLIFASHSPILLSDIPKGNVCFLQREDDSKNHGFKVENKEPPLSNTFGANIFELYKESFFLKNGLMGQFALEKINDLLERAAKWQELRRKEHLSEAEAQKLKEVRFTFEDEKLLLLIGERMIRDYLKKVFEEMTRNV